MEMKIILIYIQWGTPVFSTTKTGRHDIAEILLKVALKHQKQKNLNHFSWKLQYKVWQSIKDFFFLYVTIIVLCFCYLFPL